MDSDTDLVQLTLVASPKGLKITQRNFREITQYIIPFTATTQAPGNTASSPEIAIFGILGHIDLWPGHLIFISRYTKAAAWSTTAGMSHEIKKVEKTLIVPLEYQGAYDAILKHSRMISQKPAKNKTGANELSSVQEGNTEISTTIPVKFRNVRTDSDTKNEIRPATRTKLLNELASIYASGVYFSSTLDLTKSLPEQMKMPLKVLDETNQRSKKPSRPVFLFNENILKAVPEQLSSLTVMAIQGFASSRVINLAGDRLILISRRSTQRIGVRYLRRGIDMDSNCANYVETEQTLAMNDDMGTDINNRCFNRFASFTIIRGSIPLFFTQSPYKLHPTPIVISTLAKESQAFEQHFANLYESYGQVLGVSLVNRTGRERELGQSYMRMASNTGNKMTPLVEIEWFDFHAVCKGMRFDRVKELFDTQVGDKLNQWGWSEIFTDSTVGLDTRRKQSGVLRVNCVDCLDRTNVVEMECSKRILLKQLRLDQKQNSEPDHDNINITLRKPISAEFHAIWADNGDDISLQYSRTLALKSDFTRLAYRTYSGILQDGIKTLTRLYSGIVPDFFTQAVLDYITGNEAALHQFDFCFQATDPVELTLMEQAVKIAVSIIVGTNVENNLENISHSDNDSSSCDYQSCNNSITADANSETDVLITYPNFQGLDELVGAWWIQVPPPSRTDTKADHVWGTEVNNLTQGGTQNGIGGRPVERILILTHDAMYICEYDFNEGRVSKFNQVHINDIENIKVSRRTPNAKTYYNDGLNIDNAIQMIFSTCDGVSRSGGYRLALKLSNVYNSSKENGQQRNQQDPASELKSIDEFLGSLASKVSIDFDPTWNSSPLDKTDLLIFMEKINLFMKQKIWG